MPLSDNFKILLLKLRESVEFPLLYIEVIIVNEIKRQLIDFKSEVNTIINIRTKMRPN